MAWLRRAAVLVHNLFRDRGDLILQNFVLRQQFAILHQCSKRPRFRKRDRIYWTPLARFWSNWRSVLGILQPETVLRWHQQGFRLYWRWKSRSGKIGRPKIDAEVRRFTRCLSRENPFWGTPRIQSELRLLGYDVLKATVDAYRIRHRQPPSPAWRTFLDNHVRDIVAVDFLPVPSATFGFLFCFTVLRHHRRMVVHFSATAHPTAEWRAQQMIEAFPEQTAPRFLIRNRDSTYASSSASESSTWVSTKC